MEELKRRDEREKGWGLDRAIEKADNNSDNTGTIEEFRKKMEQLLGNI
jgi:dephospho-CoA kinase